MAADTLITSRRQLLAQGTRACAAVSVGMVEPSLASDARRLNDLVIDAEEMIANLGFIAEAILEAAIEAQGDFPSARAIVVASQKLGQDIQTFEEEWQFQAALLSHNLAKGLNPAGLHAGHGLALSEPLAG